MRAQNYLTKNKCSSIRQKYPEKSIRQSLLIKALKGRAEVNYLTGKFDGGIRDYTQILQKCGEKNKDGDFSIIVDTMIHIANILAVGKSDFWVAKTLIKKAFKKLNKKMNPRTYARGLNCLGIIFGRESKYVQALNYFRRALCIYQALKEKEGIAGVYSNIALTYYNKGNFDIALKHYKKCFILCRYSNDPQTIGTTLSNIGLVYQEKGQYENSLKYYKDY